MSTVNFIRIDPRDQRARAAFDAVERVDLSIDGAFEGGSGAIWADRVGEARVYMIEVGPFRYFAGDAGSSAAREVVERLAPGTIVMPSGAGWFDLAKSVFAEGVEEAPRWSFSSTGLDRAMLTGILRGSRDAARIVRIDESSLSSTVMTGVPFDLAAFRRTEDFLERGVGFLLPRNGKAIGIAYSSLSCREGIEVSVYVSPGFRRQGYGTQLAARLVDWCLEQGVPSHWDAANHESCLLATKLGYPTGRGYHSLIISGENAG